MEFNKCIDLLHVSKFLEKEMQEVNETWAKQMISKIKKEEEMNETFEPNENEKNTYTDIMEKAGKLNDKQREKFFHNISKEDGDVFTKVSTYNSNKKTLKQMIDNIAEYERYLEIETEFKAQIDNAIPSNPLIAQ